MRNKKVFFEAFNVEPLPVEPWQILSVERLPGDREFEQWGSDGREILAWFDLGDVRDDLSESSTRQPTPSAWSRVVRWFHLAFRPIRLAWNS